jgi:hypothetical protein
MNAKPLAMVPTASVAISEGMRNRVTRRPLASPQAAPRARQATMPTGTAKPP